MRIFKRKIIYCYILISTLFSENILFQFKQEHVNLNKNQLLKLIKLPKNIKIDKWLKSSTSIDIINESNLSLIYRLSVPKNNFFNSKEIFQYLKNSNEIRLVEIENTHQIHYNPNDPQFSEQWYLDQINLQEALDYWDIDNGNIPNSENILLVAVDVGVDWTHEDLISNIWQNLDEDVDNDGKTIECNGTIVNNQCNGNWELDPDDLNGIDDDNWDGNESTFIDDLMKILFSIKQKRNNPKPTNNVKPFRFNKPFRPVYKKKTKVIQKPQVQKQINLLL